MKIYSIYDTAAEVYGRPFIQLAHGEALRTFGRLVNDPSTEFHVKPSDFTLFYLGEYDDKTGQIDQHAPQSLGTGHEYVEEKHANPPLTDGSSL